jgi:prepilin-type N-terminal cleavage/methylation domain-containing protein
MSLHSTKSFGSEQKGFSLIELVIVMAVVGVITTTLYTFFNTNFSQYITLQNNNVRHGEITIQSQRMSSVLRGLTDIAAATNSDLSFYAYLSPRDDVVSLIRYYKSADGTKLYADVTPMTANPPGGSQITAQKKTITVLENFYAANGINLFDYLDSSGNALPQPVSNLMSIKGIRVNLGVTTKAPVANGNEVVSTQVSLRNRKNNL